MSTSILIGTYPSGQPLADNTTWFFPPGQLSSNIAAENRAEMAVRDAGTFQKLFCYVPANTASVSTTVTLRKSRADTALLVTYTADLTGILENTSDTVAFAATDEAAFEITIPTEGGNNTFTISVLACEFVPDTIGNTVSFFVGAPASGGVSTATASTTSYLVPRGGIQTLTDTTEARQTYRVRSAAVAQDLRTFVSANARTTNTVVRTRKNAVDGGQSVTYTSTLTGQLEDTTGTDTLAAGDDYNYSLTTGTGTETITFYHFATSLVSTNDDFANMVGGNSGLAFVFNGTNYVGIGGGLLGASATEIRSQMYPRTTFTAKELTCYASANTITVSATTVTLRDNGVDSAVTVSFAASETGLKNDSANTAEIATGADEVNLKVVTPNTSGTITFNWMGILGLATVPSGGPTSFSSFTLLGVQ